MVMSLRTAQKSSTVLTKAVRTVCSMQLLNKYLKSTEPKASHFIFFYNLHDPYSFQPS